MTIKHESVRTHTIYDGEMNGQNEIDNHCLDNDEQKGPLSKDNCQMEENQDSDSYDKDDNNSNLESSIRVLFAHFCSAFVQDDSSLHAMMDDDEIRRLWLSQDFDIEDSVDYRVGEVNDEGIWHCRPFSNELVSLATLNFDADFIDLCYEVPPQGGMTDQEHFHTMASFSTEAFPNICQLTCDSLPLTQLPTMGTDCCDSQSL